jgi:hypothetical protein
MLITPMLLALATVPVLSDVQGEGVRLRVWVRASVYTYELTNLGLEPITRFEVPYTNSYYFNVPAGWEHDADDDVFRAWTADPGSAIRCGQAAEFFFRVTSGGAVLGHVAAQVGRGDGSMTTLVNTWGPVPEPRQHILFVAAVVAWLMMLHTGVAARAECRTAGEKRVT